MSLENERICPEDPLWILLKASMIPDGATVSKRTGEKEYVLRRQLKIHHLDKPLVIDGLFIFDDRGNVNQVAEDTLLHWRIVAEELVDSLKRSWEPIMQ